MSTIPFPQPASDRATLENALNRIAAAAPKASRRPSPESFVLRHGIYQCWSPLPSALPKMPVRQCYHNAYQVVSRAPADWVYCEGFAFTSGVPILHAWVAPTDAPNMCFDITWEPRWCPSVYLGIPFDFDYVRRCYYTLKGFALLDSWADGWPLLNGKHPIDKAIWRPAR